MTKVYQFRDAGGGTVRVYQLNLDDPDVVRIDCPGGGYVLLNVEQGRELIEKLTEILDRAEALRLPMKKEW